VPQKLDATTISGYKTPDGAWKYTSYGYDGLARPSSVANPDGTSVGHSYSDWTDEVTNERGHKKRSYLDAFGKLVKVEELDASNSVYATTTYAYDEDVERGFFSNTFANRFLLFLQGFARKAAQSAE
jgi:YD repeat-containing protein